MKLRIYASTLAAALVALLATQAHASTLTWDATAGGAINDGGGAWLGAGQWNNGSPSATWSAGDDAIFGVGGTGGAVTLGVGGTTVNSLTLNSYATTGYTLGTAGNAITLNTGITKNAGGIAATIVSPVTLGGAQTWLNNSAGVLTLSGAVNNNGNLLTIDGTGNTTFGAVTVSGGGGLTKNGPGYLSIKDATLSYTGATTINGGGVLFYNALSSGNLTLNGGYLESYYGNNMTRTLGSGAGQIQILGGVSGFSEQGISSTVTLNNSAGFEVVWGAANEAGNGLATGCFNPSTLLLQSNTVNSGKSITFANKVDLNGTTRTIQVNKDLVSPATLSGAIRSSNGTAGIIKTGVGKLILSGTNTYNGGTTVSTGILQFNAAGAIAGSGRNVSVATGATVAAGYAMDSSFLGRLVETSNSFSVALGLASSNALNFSTAANLPYASLGALGSFTYSGTLTPNGSTFRLGGGGGTLTVSSALTGLGNALVVGGGGVILTNIGNSYDGATTLNAGGALTVSGNGVINASTAIIFNGGALALTNTTSVEGGINRVKDNAAVTSYGGSLTYNNTSGNTYAEALGAVGFVSGQLDVVEAVNMAAGSQTLTLGGLTHSGSSNVAAVTFSALGTGPNATTNMIKVTGTSPLPAGQIVGPWATLGTATNVQTDYAVYDGSSNIVAAAIGATAETTWTTAANAYSLSGATTLSTTRTLTALRYTGAAATLALAGNSLETFGILNGGTGLLTISSTGGGVRQQGTNPANLYVTTGKSAITISAPVQDNTGALTLVKSGSGGTLILSGTNTYSGDTVVNAGTLQLNSANASNDKSTVTIAATGATLNLHFSGTDTVGQLYIGATRLADGIYKAVGSAATGTQLAQLTGTGTLTVADTTPPTLPGSSIVDDRSGAPIMQGAVVTYTLTFSEPMDASTVTAAAFGNAGTSDVTIGTVSQVSPAVFTVQVTPNSVGTLQLQIHATAVLKDIIGNVMVTTPAIVDDTTIGITSSDVTPPTLSSITDDKGSVTIAGNDPVTYTVTFSEAMFATTVDATDFGNAGTAPVTIGTISQVSPTVFTVQLTPAGTGTLQLKINAGAVLTDLAGNQLVTTSPILGSNTITVDATAPTLTGIVDNESGGPVQVNTPVTYTVTFSEDMDASTVSAADFGNAGTASIIIGSVTETTPTSGIFTVQITPTGTGTLQLQINASAELKDVVGNALDTSSALLDDTTLTVNPDTTAPAPDPMTWVSAPAGASATSIAMTATTAADVSGVEYSFECVSGGGHSSGWQTSATYTDTGLTTNASYSYRVQARDKSPAQNTTGFSATVPATTSQIGTFSNSATPPAVNGMDIANLATASDSDKWWYDTARGQTFKTGASAVVLKALTYKMAGGAKKAAPTTWTIRLGAISGTAFNELASMVCTQSVDTGVADYITWTFGTPVELAPNTNYGIDASFSTSMDWPTGIPYIEYTGNGYADGQFYYSGANGVGGSSFTVTSNQDRVFHLDMDLVAPALTSIADDKSGGPVTANTLVTYTVTFNKDMDDTTVSAASFSNAGTAGVSIGTVIETAPTSGIFTVPVTPTSAGTLQLQIPAGAVLKDTLGNALVTTAALLDDTTLTVNPASGYATWAGAAAFTDDANSDGIANGLAWLFGAASPNDPVTLPAAARESGFLTLHFNRVSDQGSAKLYVVYSNDLTTWSTPAEIPAASGSVDDIEVVVVAASPPVSPHDTVTVKIPTTHASASGKLFARLQATEN